MNYAGIIHEVLGCKSYDELSAYLDSLYKEIYIIDFLSELSNDIWEKINELKQQEAILDFVEWNHFTGEWNIIKPSEMTSSASVFASVLFWVDERSKPFGSL